MGETTRKFERGARVSFLCRLGGRLDFTPRTIAAVFCGGWLTGLAIRAVVPGAYGVSGNQGDLAQMDSGLISTHVNYRTGTDAGSSKHVLRAQSNGWAIHFAPDGQVLDVTKN